MPGIKKNLMKTDKNVVWITGASSGIGAALAHHYAQKGARLILSSRRTSALEKVKSECANTDYIKILPLDLNDYDTAGDIVQKAVDFFGKVDVLINNAGVSQRSLIIDTELNVFKKHLIQCQ